MKREFARSREFSLALFLITSRFSSLPFFLLGRKISRVRKRGGGVCARGTQCALLEHKPVHKDHIHAFFGVSARSIVRESVRMR